MTGVLVFKAIRPGRFNDAVFATTIRAAAAKAAQDMHTDFKSTTATWSHYVEFETLFDMNPGPTVFIGTDDKIYGYVNDGTVPHPIFPKHAKALSFQWGGKGSYRAKTTPGVIGSQPGGPTGPRVAKPYVQHPGTKARRFDVAMLKRWDPRFKRRMEDAMSEAARASGHSI